jgi:ribonuclease BN (tRNA processing enzyme)
VEHVLSGLADEPLWPVRLKNMPAVIRFTALSVAPGDEGRTWKGITVRWCPVHHPGGCTAYRFDEEGTGASVVIATDLEWAESTPAEQEALLSLCGEPEPAEVLFIDGQFTPAEYERFAGWGHSRWTDAVEIADRSQAEQLRVIHHAPDASDEKLRQVDRDVREALPGASLARQGVAIELGFPSAEAR